jgi:predicted RNase H-like HicB family nuclease
MDEEYTADELLEASRYPVVVQWSPKDQLFLATLPDMEGLTVHGDSPEEAILEATRAAADWLYGMRHSGYPIPSPTPITISR